MVQNELKKKKNFVHVNIAFDTFGDAGRVTVLTMF